MFNYAESAQAEKIHEEEVSHMGRRRKGNPTEFVNSAASLARDLRQELRRALVTAPYFDDSWLALIEDVELIERRLNGVLQTQSVLFNGDPDSAVEEQGHSETQGTFPESKSIMSTRISESRTESTLSEVAQSLHIDQKTLARRLKSQGIVPEQDQLDRRRRVLNPEQIATIAQSLGRTDEPLPRVPGRIASGNSDIAGSAQSSGIDRSATSGNRIDPPNRHASSKLPESLSERDTLSKLAEISSSERLALLEQRLDELTEQIRKSMTQES